MFFWGLEVGFSLGTKKIYDFEVVCVLVLNVRSSTVNSHHAEIHTAARA